MKRLLFSLFFFLISTAIFSNNIEVDSISLVAQNAAEDTVRIQFDLSWDNSWRLSSGPSNWDAAWVFIKFRSNGNEWKHANLNYVDGTNDGHTSPPDVTIKTASSGIGCFIYRSINGNGSVDWDNIELSWDYGAEGIDDDDILDIQIFAVEMVYIPSGSFYVGGKAGTEDNKFYTHPSTNDSYQITSENAINVGSTNGYLNYDSGGNGGDGLGPVPAAFPKGYDAFYCMKYEASEEQWVSFFNTLTPTQKGNRDITDFQHKGSDGVINRNTVSWGNGTGSASTDAPDRACNFIGMADGLAYHDWSGLRPLSELEFEKSCRGPIEVKANEFAWGNANVNNEDYNIGSNGQSSEYILNAGIGTGNAAYFNTANVIDGPLRCGIFAFSAVNKNREETGGSYYGVMELSGNLYERAVSVGDPTGRLFTGEHGDGVLNAGGDHTTNFWPSIFTGDGSTLRGGYYDDISIEMRVSDRTYGAYNTLSGNRARGIRGARTAP